LLSVKYFYYMAKRTPPFEEYENWSQAKFFGYIRSGLRQKWMRWPPKFECLKSSRVEVEGQGRTKYNYKCKKCGGLFKAKEVEVDHIEPAGSLRSFEEIEGFCRRLFVGKEKLRVVCKQCHKIITAKERAKKKAIGK